MATNDNCKKLNNLIPLYFSNDDKDKQYDYKNIDFHKIPEIKSVVQEICSKIQDLKSSSDTIRKIIILKGRYGSGKTAVCQSVLQNTLKTGTFNKSHVWYICMTHYSTLESIFQFLAGKAKELGLQDLYSVLVKPKTKPKLRKKAAIKVSLHCNLLLLDNIDANDDFDESLLNSIFNDRLIIFCTIGSDECNGKDDKYVYEIPDIKFSDIKHLCAYISDVNYFQHQEELLYIANKVGPFVASVMFRAITSEVISVVELKAALEKYEHITNNVVEKLLSFIFNNLSDSDRNILINVASMRMPFPLKQKEFANNLLHLKLLKKYVSNGHQFLEVPFFISTFALKFQMKDNLENSHGFNGLPTAADFWKDLLPPKLTELVKQAQGHAWPFAPETWQYKEVIDESERYNLKDLIHKRNEFSNLEEIDILQECLYSSLIMEDYESSSALLFIMDRFIYWQGTSQGTISVLNYIQQKSPSTAIAPQLIIRKARMLKNDGDIQGAERILNSLLHNEKQLGQWTYQNTSDHDLISSVCIQIKGDILRNLGLWTAAAQNLIDSIKGFRSLPKPDKKGWASSLSLLADAFQYMSAADFKSNMVEKYKLSASHPVLEAMSCVEEAARLSIYSPLFYTKNKRRAGELSSIYSKLLPDASEGKRTFLIFAATECLEGLRCHRSIASLESREQYYEFVYCVHKLSQVCQELMKLPVQLRIKMNEPMITALNDISLLLYEHYCSLEMKFQHSDWSSNLIRTTLKLLLLPDIPSVENIVLPRGTQNTNQSDKSESSETTMLGNPGEAECLSTGPSTSTDITAMATLEDDISNSEEMSSESLNQIRTAKTMTTDDEKSSANDTVEFDIRAASTVTETIDMNYEPNISREPVTDNELQRRSLGELSTVDSGVSSQSSETDSHENGSLCHEDTQITSETEPPSADAKSRIQKTMTTFEECSTMDIESKNMEHMLNIIKSTKRKRVHGANVWRYNPQIRNWTSAETLAYVGDRLELGDKAGACRDAYMFEYINQEEPMSKYIGKQYKLEKYKKNPRTMKQYRQDIICQVTSRFYVTQFNQEMYHRGLPFGQVQFLPAVLIELKDIENEPERYFNVEPYMAGDFQKITNNMKWVVKGDVQEKDLLLAFSHFSYCFSNGKLIIVDIQGWTSDDKVGATFLTDPQIHTLDKKGFGTANKGFNGFKEFWVSQHPQCNDICKSLELKRPKA